MELSSAGGSDTGGHVEAAVAAEDDAPSRRAYHRRGILPIANEEGKRTWVVVGPIGKPVNPETFRFDAKVVAHPRWTGREVFARVVPALVSRERYSSAAAAHESLQILSRSSQLDDDDGVEEPSWLGLLGLGRDLSPTECARLLARAKLAVTKNKGRRHMGDVTITEIGDGSRHPWSRYGTELDLKRVASHSGTQRGDTRPQGCCRHRRRCVTSSEVR